MFKQFAETLSKPGMQPLISEREARWQVGLVGRHARVVTEISLTMVEQCPIERGRRPSYSGRTGHSARTLVFEVAERFPMSVDAAIYAFDSPRLGKHAGSIIVFGMHRCVRLVYHRPELVS